MAELFQVSVIIPVYNAANFVIEAVQSALTQPEVEEVILVEDGSQDNSLEICEMLAAKEEKVRLLIHPQGINRGVSVSRNVGIQNARFEFIAFLDADDWYLPGRFTKDQLLFENPDVMAVYSLSSIQYPNGKEELFGNKEDLIEKLGTTDLEKVYCHILRNDVILGHTNANTFRKSVFKTVGFFDERLFLHQDTEIWIRIARKYLFWPGELSRPVSVARRHSNNRIIGKSKESHFRLLFSWVDNIGLDMLYPSEKEYLIYLYSRAISNSIRPHWVRKLVLHASINVLAAFRETFIRRFYHSFKSDYA